MERCMDLARRFYSRDLKIAAMREIDGGRRIGEIARHLEVSPQLLERWRGEWQARAYDFQLRPFRMGDLRTADRRRVPRHPVSCRFARSPPLGRACAQGARNHYLVRSLTA